MRHLPALLLTVLVFIVSPAHAATADLFRDGDRWAVVGDSVTQNGYYHTWIAVYYATRFPDRAIDIFNCGISGDSAAGALRRYDWDIAAKKPTVATVMLGMNDVNRNLYAELPSGSTEPSPDILKRRADALAAYRKNMTQLIARLQADGARVQLLTPSIYDETMQSDRAAANLPGVNSLALADCAQFARDTAAASDGKIGLIEIHRPMTTLNAKLQQADPAFTLVGPDRVHPRQAGHFVMAYYFLQSQGAPAEVSHVAIDASGANPRVTRVRNATVTALTRTAADGAATLTFTVNAAALPCPVEKNATPALDYIPFTDDLNRETLVVESLAPGNYTLAIDQQIIRTWTAAELATGVNLATLPGTPQAKQAAGVLELVMQWRALVAHGDRGVAQVEHFHLRDVAHPVSFDDVRARLEALVEKWNGSDNRMDNYNRGVVQRYLKMKPQEAETQTRIRALVEQIRVAARPQPHVYRLTPASG
ncbi:hydrolase GDSL [Opitutaceae bacterium TAV5]|nr:hydrolase GDSL [Opitutaceae bacterium TAV5]